MSHCTYLASVYLPITVSPLSFSNEHWPHRHSLRCLSKSGRGAGDVLSLIATTAKARCMTNTHRQTTTRSTEPRAKLTRATAPSRPRAGHHSGEALRHGGHGRPLLQGRMRPLYGLPLARGRGLRDGRGGLEPVLLPRVHGRGLGARAREPGGSGVAPRSRMRYSSSPRSRTRSDPARLSSALASQGRSKPCASF